MNDIFEAIEVEYPASVPPEPKRHGVRCPCGRFAKWVGDQHYYNGSFDCYRFTTLCSVCGEQDTECV